ncbi:MAG: hypothetical protein COB54_01210 [Alphaproteobacteria bacterium]|nr:MAG: hypothetical protein COB54_01210 [Alphaproteobacteria bacterium]
MTEISIPVQSTKTLLKATVYAGLVAGVLLVTVILPAEYHLDPTGVGKALGVMELSATSSPSAASAKDSLAVVVPVVPVVAVRSDTTMVTVPAGYGVEYKFHLLEGGRLKYSWSSEDVPLYFDFHGEPEGDTTGFFESFTISTAEEVSGTFTAPFTGIHGWYWKNKSGEDIEVTLTTEGSYEIIAKK